MQQNSPFIELFKRGIKTGAFEDYIQSIREPLEQRGVRTDAFSMHAPTPMMCLWTESQRKRLLKRARDYDAVVVLACNGIMNATAKIQFPMTVTLEPHMESKVEFTISPKSGAAESHTAH
jgi:hypothetical protein